MSVTPFVYPPNDETGVELSPSITAIFDFALDQGTVAKHNCFLIKKTSLYSSHSVCPIDSEIELNRVELLTENEHTVPDYGDDPDSGEQYRSKITIAPILLLESFTEYSVVLSKEISAVTVFDVKDGVGNTGSSIEAKGPFKGSSSDIYTISITSSGDYGSAKYSWARSSDSYAETGLVARNRNIEIDRDLFIKFPIGDFVSGDTFTVRVKPEQLINETIVWNFTTGSESQVEPDDDKSDSVVNLPVISDSGGDTDQFRLLSVTPYNYQSMVHPGAIAKTVVSGIVFATINQTTDYNDKRIKILDGGGTFSLYESGNDIIFEILTQITTHQEIVDALAGSTIEVEALTVTPDQKVELHLSGQPLLGGVEPPEVIFEFSKNLDNTKISEANIQVLYESLIDVEKGTLDYTYEVIDNKLKIKMA